MRMCYLSPGLDLGGLTQYNPEPQDFKKSYAPKPKFFTHIWLLLFYLYLKLTYIFDIQ